jgi:hypothetical protein
VLGPVVVVVAAALALTVPAAAWSKASGEPWQAAPSAIVQAVTHVAPSVFDAVGLQSGVAAPVLLHGQPSLTFDGKPGIFYEASEPCPFCAAQRWAFVVALARFGSWSKLGIAQSATDDVDPATQTFTFSRATYSSPYVALRTREHFSEQKLPGGRYAVLQPSTAEETRLYNDYSAAKYFPSDPGSFPFMDFGNRVVVSSSSFNPYVLHGLSRSQIATDLSDPHNPVTMDIVATANYLTAAVCLVDGGRPGAVCQSPGVRQSAHFVKISYGYGVGGCTTSGTGQAICGGSNASEEG